MSLRAVAVASYSGTAAFKHPGSGKVGQGGRLNVVSVFSLAGGASSKK